MVFLMADQNQSSIRSRIEKEISGRLREKRSSRKKLKSVLEPFYRRVRWAIINSVFPVRISVKRFQGRSIFGCDQFGRDVEDGLFQYVKLLKRRHLEIHTVIILGSRAKGSWKPESDIDVTVVADNLPEEGTNIMNRRVFDSRRHVLRDTPLCLGIEPTGCCSKKEFLERLKRFDLVALDAIFYGKIIYDDGFWAEVIEAFKELEQVYELSKINLKLLLRPI
jgi:hypothetical protein